FGQCYSSRSLEIRPNLLAQPFGALTIPFVTLENLAAGRASFALMTRAPVTLRFGQSRQVPLKVVTPVFRQEQVKRGRQFEFRRVVATFLHYDSCEQC